MQQGPWEKHQQRIEKPTRFYTCTICLYRGVYQTLDELLSHAATHPGPPPPDVNNLTEVPQTSPLTPEQLEEAAKEEYAQLEAAEVKCKEQVKLVNSQRNLNLKTQPEQWQELCESHESLLHDYQELLRVTQQPAVDRKLLGRMSLRCIQPYFNLGWRGLPLDYFLKFFYFAYSMLSLMLTTLRGLDDRLIEGLGDLSRYRMMIEDDEESPDRKHWAEVARGWYLKASDKSSNDWLSLSSYSYRFKA